MSQVWNYPRKPEPMDQWFDRKVNGSYTKELAYPSLKARGLWGDADKAASAIGAIIRRLPGQSVESYAHRVSAAVDWFVANEKTKIQPHDISSNADEEEYRCRSCGADWFQSCDGRKCSDEYVASLRGIT